MKILYIKATPKTVEDSWTLKMSEFFVQEYKKCHPDHIITEFSLYKENISYLDKDDLMAMMGADKGAFAKEVDHFLEYDKYIVAAPFWNLSIPAILRTYLDRIIVKDRTFSFTENGPQPLLPEKNTAFFMARGGFYPEDAPNSIEYGFRYWESLSSNFLGLNNTAFLLEGTELLEEKVLLEALDVKKLEIVDYVQVF